MHCVNCGSEISQWQFFKSNFKSLDYIKENYISNDLNMDSDSNLNSRNSIHNIGFDEEMSSLQFKSKKSKSKFSGFSVTSI